MLVFVKAYASCLLCDCVSDIGWGTCCRYATLAKHVMRYEKEWFGVWRDKVDAVALHHLKQSVLLKQADTGVCDSSCGSILP
jgi:hypothetical protein